VPKKPKPAGRQPRLLVEDERTIDPSLLETFAYEDPGREVVIDISTDEFTAVCPWSGLPDFGTVRVRYVPRARLLELRSFKYYLLTYRNVGIVQEHAVRRMLRDLVRVARPRRLTVELDYKVRGGVHTVCAARFGRGPTRG
jgi:7-cyano-7-deazaguanine reductase